MHNGKQVCVGQVSEYADSFIQRSMSTMNETIILFYVSFPWLERIACYCYCYFLSVMALLGFDCCWGHLTVSVAEDVTSYFFPFRTYCFPLFIFEPCKSNLQTFLRPGLDNWAQRIQHIETLFHSFRYITLFQDFYLNKLIILFPDDPTPERVLACSFSVS